MPIPVLLIVPLILLPGLAVYWWTRIHTMQANRSRKPASHGGGPGKPEISLKAFIESSPVAMVLLDANRLVTGWNKAAERAFQWTEQEIAGKPAPWIEDGGNLPSLLDQVFGGQFAQAEIQRKRKDGSQLDLNVWAAPILYADGRVNGAMFAAIDVTDHRQSQERLVAALERLRDMQTIIDKSPVIVFRWRAEPGSPADFVSDNIRHFGYTPEDFTSNRVSVWTCMHPQDVERARGLVRKCGREDLNEYAMEYRIVTKSGDVRWVYDLTWLVRDSNYVVKYYQGLLIDITERKLAEEAVYKEKERLAVTLSGIGDGVIAVDISAKVVMMNPVAEALTGWTSSEAQGRALPEVFNIINEITRSPAEDPVRRVLDEGRIVGLANHTALIARDGTERSIADSAAPLRDTGGVAFGAILVFRDVTEERRQEMALRASEERFRLLAENAHDVIFLLHLLPERRWEYVSPSAGAVLGYSPEEFYAEPGLDMRIAHPADQHLLSTLWSGVADTGSPAVFRLISKNGQPVWIESKVSQVRDQHGELAAVQGIMRDISERRRMEEHIRYASMHDPLTGLYNRGYFEQEMRRLEGGREYPITIVCSDIDGLKLVNDTLGHDKGDKMLRAYAEVLGTVFRQSDAVSRIGGDEFAVILPRTDGAGAETLSRRLESALAAHNHLRDDLPLSASVGIATCASRDITLEEVFSHADKNMYRDKVHKTASAAHGVVKALLTALAAKDYVAEGHISRVSHLCSRLGEAIGLSKKELADLALLAEVHDLGKVGIPDRILFKEGVLTNDEREQIKQHSTIGYRIARSSPELSHISDLILHHHEWWSGSGYPSQLSGADIPICCRVLAIVDAYDAMTNDRPYSKAMSQDEAVRELTEYSGTQFDPLLVPQFIGVLQREGERAADET